MFKKLSEKSLLAVDGGKRLVWALVPVRKYLRNRFGTLYSVTTYQWQLVWR